MKFKEINSSSNDTIKWIKKLQTKAKARHEEKLYVVEGYRQIKELSQGQIHTLITCNKKDFKDFDGWTTVEGIYVNEKLFQEISVDPSPQGIMALVHMKSHVFKEEEINTQGLYIALDSIQDPGNLGTIIRVADAVNVDGIFINKTTVDMYNSKVVKGTMGSLEHVPFYRVDNLCDVITALKAKDIKIFGAYMEDSISHFEGDYSDGCCIVIGNEGNGISEAVIQNVDLRIKIPMPGKSESLNASVATSVILYEALRQRTI